LGGFRVDEKTVKDILIGANLAIENSLRLPNNRGVQFHLVCGAIINLYDTGKITIQGKNQQSVIPLFTSTSSKTTREERQLDFIDRLALNNKSVINKPSDHDCLLCRSGNNLQVHHIDGHHKNNYSENCINLCERCHTELHRNGGYADLTREVLIELRAKVDKRREELAGSQITESERK
jgi:5-methylcytosine-specific restriction endonuclease McrA